MWYRSIIYDQYPYEGAYRCSSDRTGVLDFQIDSDPYTGAVEYIMIYYYLTGDPTDPLTITCPDWRNPIVPKVDDGYIMIITDIAGYTIEVSEPFSIDATNFLPYPILA